MGTRIERLERLAELRKMGALTDLEFEAQKTLLLGSPGVSATQDKPPSEPQSMVTSARYEGRPSINTDSVRVEENRAYLGKNLLGQIKWLPLSGLILLLLTIVFIAHLTNTPLAKVASTEGAASSGAGTKQWTEPLTNSKVLALLKQQEDPLMGCAEWTITFGGAVTQLNNRVQQNGREFSLAMSQISDPTQQNLVSQNFQRQTNAIEDDSQPEIDSAETAGTRACEAYEPLARRATAMLSGHKEVSAAVAQCGNMASRALKMLTVTPTKIVAKDYLTWPEINGEQLSCIENLERAARNEGINWKRPPSK